MNIESNFSRGSIPLSVLFPRKRESSNFVNEIPAYAGKATENNIPEAWVVFTGQSDLPWLRLLKPGFRHCYVLLNDGASWVSLDPLSNCMDISVHHHVPAEFDFPRWLKTRGHTVVRAPVTRIRKEAPWMIFTCTEAVKRVLGLHKRFIITPWQLYKYLQDEGMKGSRYDGKRSHNPFISLSHHLSNKGEPAWEV